MAHLLSPTTANRKITALVAALFCAGANANTPCHQADTSVETTAIVADARLVASSQAVADLEWHDSARDHRIPVRLYWPDSAAHGGTVPLILFSHGIGGSRAGYGHLTHRRPIACGSSRRRGALKVLAVFEGGSHSVFMDRCGSGDVPQRIRAATRDLSVAFLQRVFDGEADQQAGGLACWGSVHRGVLASYRVRRGACDPQIACGTQRPSTCVLRARRQPCAARYGRPASGCAR